MNCIKTNIALVALCLSTAIVSGCGNSSHTASIPATLILSGSYIATGNGSNIALVFDSRGCMVGVDASYNSANRMTTANWLATGGSYSVIGDTVRVSGGTVTPFGQVWHAQHGGGFGGDTELLTIANNGQSLNATTSSGQVVQFIKQQ